MTNKVVILFLIYLSVLASCRADQQKYVSIQEALESMKRIVIKYDEKLDKSVKFPELQSAIDAISTSMHEYRGTASKHVPKIQELNRNAKIGYTDCVGPVYSWCVSMNSTLELILERMEQGMSVADRRFVKRLAGGLLVYGNEHITKSLGLLQQVRKDIARLKDEFDALLSDIHIDFGDSGEYGKYKKQLIERKASIVTAEIALSAVSFLNLLFTVCLTIVAGPIGLALGLGSVFLSAGLAVSVVYLDSQRRSIEYELDYIEKFFVTLDTKTNEALIIVKELQTALAKEETHLHDLQGYIMAAEVDGIALLEDSWVNALAPTYRKLGESCYKYATNHGLAVMIMNSRRRREAADECNVRRNRWTRAFEAYIPKNSTNKDILLEKAGTIADNMHCDTLTTLTTSHDNFKESPPAYVGMASKFTM